MIDKFEKPKLPDALQKVNFEKLPDIDPKELILNPGNFPFDVHSAGRAIIYARAGNQDYANIAFRVFAASPLRGVVPLQTSKWSAFQHQLHESKLEYKFVDEILSQQPSMRHRPISFPAEGESFDYQIDKDTLHLFRKLTDSEGREVKDRWIYSLTDLPEALMAGAVARDEPILVGHQLKVKTEGTFWLPYSELVNRGKFERFQNLRPFLSRDIQTNSFCIFLSHRWLAKDQPDPDALQAQFAAWQILSCLVEAVRVAHQRGLHKPRLFSEKLGTTVGVRGSDLAESIIANVIREVMDVISLDMVAAEVERLETYFDDNGVAKALNDKGLNELRQLLNQCPVLSELSRNIYIWYDYSCLPQPPMEGDEKELFSAGLKELTVAQILGRTVIMLDDVDDYLSRAWCTLEVLTSDTVGNSTDLIVGSARPSSKSGEVEHYFFDLLQDTPHITWRAILDTELFEIQSPDICMKRLGLEATEQKDLQFIYKRLVDLGAPRKIHIDDSEIVTGVFPIPAFENNIAILANTSIVNKSLTTEPMQSLSLDWTRVLKISEAWTQGKDSIASMPPFYMVPTPEMDVAFHCHVAVVGACEGEAILFANWARRHKNELEKLLKVTVASISWVASDIAPIGKLTTGTLQALPIIAGTWIVIATESRLQHCKTTRLITSSLICAGVLHRTMAIDKVGDNVTLIEMPEPDAAQEVMNNTKIIKLEETPIKIYPGGLFVSQLQQDIL